MGLCGSSEAAPDAGIDLKIDSELKQEKVQAEKEIRVLLLGPGESGKSTVFKQMVINFGSGFTDEQRQNFAPIASQNVFGCFKTLLMNRDMIASLDSEAKISEENHVFVAKITSSSEDRHEDLPVDIIEAMEQLWKDPGFQKMLSFRLKYHIPESVEYFMPRIREIATAEYIPSNEDLLRMRARTTGISESEFVFEKTHFKIVDVGGQRSERKKWIKAFDNVNAVLFVAAIGEYDQMTWEDESANRMQEALQVFDTIVNEPVFAQIPIMLFLNKTDVFERKIPTTSLSVCFSDWDTRNDGNMDAAYSFIENKFRSKAQDSSREIYIHRTTATNAENIMKIWRVVSLIIIRKNLASTGLL